MGGDRCKVLVVHGGHPFDHECFFRMIDSLPQIEWREVAHPEAEDVLRPQAVDADVVLAYDMPGVIFRDRLPPELPPPSAEFVANIGRLFDAGQPFVFLHHAIASWPAWQEYAEFVGGRFNEAAAELRGQMWPDSGYRMDVWQTLSVVEPDHPVCAGLPASFEICDESHQCPIFEEDVTPLLVTDAPRGVDFHYSAARAIAGHFNDRTGWAHPPGSRYVAWVKRTRRSPVVYIQPGNGPMELCTGPSVYENPNYRKLLGNALLWAASPDARRWADGA
jgi:hypothetical protein